MNPAASASETVSELADWTPVLGGPGLSASFPTAAMATSGSVAAWGPGPRVAGYRCSVLQRLGLRHDQAIASDVLPLVSFGHSPDLLRGIRLASVLQSCGKILDDARGSEATYGLSERVDAIDTFVSHNWSVARWRKFVALTFYFNFAVATSAALLLGGLVVALGAMGWLPPVLLPIVDHRAICIVCRLACVPVFFFMLFFGRAAGAYFGFFGPALFLDKSCINQVDEEVQRQGIQKLAAFLRRSRFMLVLYSDVYLVKLWTVYEVASFLCLHPVSDMHIVPVVQSVVFCAGIAFLWSTELMLILFRWMGAYTKQIEIMTHAVGGLMLLVMMRIWARRRAVIHLRLASFSVRDCTCAVEQDRPLVYSNIATLMKASGHVAQDAGEEQALEAFDTLVRTALPGAFGTALGTVSFSYVQYCMLGVAGVGFRALDRVAGCLQAGSCLRRDLAIRLLTELIHTTSLIPLTLIALEVSAMFWLRLSGWREWLWLAVVYCLGIGAPASLVPAMLTRLAAAASSSQAAFAAMPVALVAGMAVTVFITSRGCPQKLQEYVFSRAGPEPV